MRVPQPRGRPRKRPRWVGADKSYGSLRVRLWLRQKRIASTIPERQDARRRPRVQNFDRGLYRHRSIIDQSVGWHKERRCLGTRYDKLAINFLAMSHLALIEQYNQWLGSDRT